MTVEVTHRVEAVNYKDAIEKFKALGSDVLKDWVEVGPARFAPVDWVDVGVEGDDF